MPLLHSDCLRLPKGVFIYRHSCERPSCPLGCSCDTITIMVAAFDGLDDAAMCVVLLGRIAAHADRLNHSCLLQVST